MIRAVRPSAQVIRQDEGRGSCTRRAASAHVRPRLVLKALPFALAGHLSASNRVRGFVSNSGEYPLCGRYGHQASHSWQPYH
jgi:hypothetical protein